jgi:endonuclease G
MPYKPDFIGGKIISFPVIADILQPEIALSIDGQTNVFDYTHHSLKMHKTRKFAFYSASNIDGNKWKAIVRKGSFKKDTKQLADSYQLGNELYNAIVANGLRPNDFEQGHLTSFQEVLWGDTEQEIKQAGADTFFFTNCVPQHERLNSGLWRSLEQYILKNETVQYGLKVSVFTGPVLSEKDPWYIEKINGQYIKIPSAFWKVIYYANAKGMNAVGFMMSHKQLLLKEKTVTFDKSEIKSLSLKKAAENHFMDYKYDAVYQVTLDFIQQETGLTFMLNGVNLPYQKEEKKEIVYSRLEIKRSPALAKITLKEPILDFKLKGIIL